MLQFAEKTATIGSVNVRAEKHGDEFVPACDIGITLNLDASVLDMLDEQLRSLLFCKRADPGDLANQGHLAPNLRFPLLGAIPWKWEGMGYTETITQGVGAGTPIIVEACEINKLVLQPMEGGTVSVAMRVQFRPDDVELYAALCPLVQHEVTLTLEPPEPAPAP